MYIKNPLDKKITTKLFKNRLIIHSGGEMPYELRNTVLKLQFT